MSTNSRPGFRLTPVLLALALGLFGGAFGLPAAFPQYFTASSLLDGAPFAPLNAPPQAPIAANSVAPAPSADSAGKFDPTAIEIPYETAGTSMMVPVTFEGPTGKNVTVDMMFDTGATLTTLNSAVLRRLGVVIPKNAPVIESSTAAGPRTSRILRLDRIWLGEQAIEGVTISECEECAIGGSAGLLGMNVSGRFLITIDTVKQDLTLHPRQDDRGATYDVMPWLSVSSRYLSRGRSGDAKVTVHNRSAAHVQELTVLLSCDVDMEVTIVDIPAQGEQHKTVTMPPGTRCHNGYNLQVLAAQW